ncbi:MAG: carbohydrate ABC transporter permease, partial [Butyrivibrio sp.]|nr:carbohydrate ABC transporter permease [Butyrivibrio sp.]
MLNKVKKVVLYIALIVLALMCLLPFWLMIVNATRSGVEITHSFSFLPGKSLRDNWKVLFDYVNLFLGFFNSVKVAVPATLLTAYFSAITAFGMAMYEWKGNNLLFKIIVIFMMIPGQLSLIGFYNLCQKLHLIDSYIPLIIPAIAAPGIVFFLRQYVQATLSKALLEAARIDGASEIHIFHRIVLPIMAPGIATMSIGAFIGNWNSYLVPLILLNTP